MTPEMQSTFSRTLTEKPSSEINEKEKERKYGKNNALLFTKDLPRISMKIKQNENSYHLQSSNTHTVLNNIIKERTAK